MQREQRVFVWISYVWRVFVNIIQLLFVLVVFSKVSQGFEVIVVSTLGLIYLTMMSIAFTSVYIQYDLVKAVDDEFVRLRRLLGDESLKDHAKVRLAALEKAERSITRISIDMTFLGIIGIICLYQLAVNGLRMSNPWH
jgi:hypothetical protein